MNAICPMCPISNKPIAVMRWRRTGTWRELYCPHCRLWHSEARLKRAQAAQLFDPQLSRLLDEAVIEYEKAEDSWGRMRWRRARQALQHAVPAFFARARKRGAA